MKFGSTGSPGAPRLSAPAENARRRLARRRPRRGQRGFTLLETLTALAIFTVALSSLMELYTADVNVLGASGRHARAHELLQSLSATELSDPATSIRNKRGSAGPYTWTLSVEPASTAIGLTEPRGPWTLQHVRLTVTWPPAGRVSLATVRMRRRDE